MPQVSRSAGGDGRLVWNFPVDISLKVLGRGVLSMLVLSMLVVVKGLLRMVLWQCCHFSW